LRLLLAEQGFTIVHAHVSKLDLEARAIRFQPSTTGPAPIVMGPGTFHSMAAYVRKAVGAAVDEDGCHRSDRRLVTFVTDDRIRM
jgi:hypothetical protein